MHTSLLHREDGHRLKHFMRRSRIFYISNGMVKPKPTWNTYMGRLKDLPEWEILAMLRTGISKH
jgi:hypothetical protein